MAQRIGLARLNPGRLPRALISVILGTHPNPAMSGFPYPDQTTHSEDEEGKEQGTDQR